MESKTGKDWFMLYSKNVGMDGIMLTCESNIEKLNNLGITTEKEVFLSFYLPGQKHTVKVSGRIVNMEVKKDPINDSDVSIICIKFNDISDQTNKQLKKFICSEEDKPII